MTTGTESELTEYQRMLAREDEIRAEILGVDIPREDFWNIVGPNENFQYLFQSEEEAIINYPYEERRQHLQPKTGTATPLRELGTYIPDKGLADIYEAIERANDGKEFYDKGDLSGQKAYRKAIRKCDKIKEAFYDSYSHEPLSSGSNRDLELATDALKARIQVVRQADFEQQIESLNTFIKEDAGSFWLTLSEIVLARLDGFYVAEDTEHENLEGDRWAEPRPVPIIASKSTPGIKLPVTLPYNPAFYRRLYHSDPA